MLFWGGVGDGDDREKEKAFESVGPGEESAFISLVSPPNEYICRDPSRTKVGKVVMGPCECAMRNCP
jgi:hypothetical protein